MPALLDVLERDYRLNGLAGLVARLCKVGTGVARRRRGFGGPLQPNQTDPFGQLDLLLQAIRDDIPSEG